MDRAVMENLAPRLLRILGSRALRLLGPGRQADVDDAVQGALVRTLAALPAVEGNSPACLAAYAQATLVNAVRGAWKHQARRSAPTPLPTGGADSPLSVPAEQEEAATLAERRAAVRAALAALARFDPLGHEALTRLYWHGEPLRAAARALGVPADTLKTRAWRARRRMKDLLEGRV